MKTENKQANNTIFIYPSRLPSYHPTFLFPSSPSICRVTARCPHTRKLLALPWVMASLMLTASGLFPLLTPSGRFTELTLLLALISPDVQGTRSLAPRLRLVAPGTLCGQVFSVMNFKACDSSPDLPVSSSDLLLSGCLHLGVLEEPQANLPKPGPRPLSSRPRRQNPDSV